MPNHKKIYTYRKCNNCGSPSEPQTMSLCVPCREVTRNNYRKRKAIGLCVHCIKNAARPNKVTCEECFLSTREASSLRTKKMAKKRKESGLCTGCGESRPLPNRLKCWRCMIIQRVASFDIPQEEKLKIKEIAKDFEQGSCGICERVVDNKKEWHIDHCHTTKTFRGFLCNNCNFLLGAAKDNTRILQSAIAYLEKSSPNANTG